MTKTTNYQLNQWDPTDRVLRTDFNSDNQKIDAALNEKCEFVTGRYTGNGAETRVISLGFTPKAVLVLREDGATTYPNNNTQVYGGLAAVGMPLKKSGLDAVAVVDGGFQVGYRTYPIDIYTNNSNQVYHYLALR